jgi:methionine aminotransferase
MQYALAEYLATPSNYEVLPSFYQEKRDLFLGKINNPLIKVLPCAGTYFALLDYSAMNQNDDVAEAIRWTKEYKLTTIPCSVFYPNKTDNKVLRVCFAKDEATLDMGAEVISGIG